MRISHLLIVSCTIFIASSALAQGKTAQQLIGACSRCHGEDGNASGQYPDLAGQQAEYTAKQLMDFKSGARKNSQMSPFVGVLTEEDMHTLGKYYADEFPKRQRGIDKDLAAVGKQTGQAHSSIGLRYASRTLRAPSGIAFDTSLAAFV